MNNQEKEKEEREEKKSFMERVEETLLQSRRVLLNEAVDSKITGELIRKFWYLDLLQPGTPILFIINSPGGSVDAGFAIWDQIKMLQSPVATLVTGLAASMGSVLSLVAPKGMRFSTPNARFMIHQPLISGVIQGQATDLGIQAKQMIIMREKLIHLYHDATGKAADEIRKAIDRDTWLDAKEAKEFGLVDEIVHSYADLKKKKAIA